jgi:hypothetical protein
LIVRLTATKRFVYQVRRVSPYAMLLVSVGDKNQNLNRL